MRRVVPVVALAAAACALPVSVAQAAPERYIVVLEESAGDPAVVAAEHGRRHEAQADKVFRTALRGYSAVIPSEKVEALRADERVQYVEADGVVSATAQTVPWGIAKVGAPSADPATFTTTTGVTAYVIDSGVAPHGDLVPGGHINFAGGKNTDCNGHGTHVAGSIAARDDASFVVGVSPSVSVVGVKVLNCKGSGTTSGVIAGVDWVAANSPGPAVANMSLGGGASTALDTAVRNLAGSGVPIAVAAGNESVDACTSSPARAGSEAPGQPANGVITTGATDQGDRAASFSNFGACVDIWAPGVGILSTSKNGGTTTMSGTSMASPHVAGGGALAIAAGTTSPSAVEQRLIDEAALTGAGPRLRVSGL